MRYCARGRQADARRRRHQHGFGQGVGAESLHDAGEMHFHRARTDTQLLCRSSCDGMRRPAARAFVIAVFDEGDGSVGRSADVVIRRDGHFQHGHDDSFQRVENPAGTGLTEGRLSPGRGARLDGSSTLAGGQQMLVQYRSHAPRYARPGRHLDRLQHRQGSWSENALRRRAG
jgi:hypothetical protein